MNKQTAYEYGEGGDEGVDGDRMYVRWGNKINYLLLVLFTKC